MKYGAVVTLKLLPEWLALDRAARREKAAELRGIVVRYHADVEVDWYDADALGTGYTDWVMCRFDSLDRYHALWEELRDLQFFSHPYAEIAQVLLGLNDGHQRYETGEL